MCQKLLFASFNLLMSLGLNEYVFNETKACSHIPFTTSFNPIIYLKCTQNDDTLFALSYRPCILIRSIQWILHFIQKLHGNMMWHIVIDIMNFGPVWSFIHCTFYIHSIHTELALEKCADMHLESLSAVSTLQLNYIMYTIYNYYDVVGDEPLQHACMVHTILNKSFSYFVFHLIKHYTICLKIIRLNFPIKTQQRRFIEYGSTEKYHQCQYEFEFKYLKD